MTEITQLLAEWTTDPVQERRLMPMIYEDLRRIARRLLSRERPDPIWSPTELVHEAFLRLRLQSRAQWQSRGHFFSVAYRVMYRLLIDSARRRGQAKRLDVKTRPRSPSLDIERQIDLVALRRALRGLARSHPQQAEVVALRYFQGMTQEETAEHLELSVSTVTRRWRAARVWLRHDLGPRDRPR